MCVCVCVYLRSIRSITSHIATHALLCLMASACVCVCVYVCSSASPSPLHSSTCVLLLLLCMTVSLSLSLFLLSMRCAQNNRAYYAALPHSLTSRTWINKYVCICVMYGNFCCRLLSCLCVSFAVRSNIVTDTQRHA